MNSPSKPLQPCAEVGNNAIGFERKIQPASPNRLVRHLHQLERLLKDRIARSLNLLAVPSNEDVLTLTRRIDKLGQVVKSSQRALAQKLKDRTAELEQNWATLQETRYRLDKANALATLASVIPALVHDMCTPVGNSNLATAALQAGLEDFRVKLARGELRRSDLDDFLNQLTQGLRIIETAGVRIGELTESLKHLSIDQASGRRRSFYLADLVDEVLITLAPTLRKTTFIVEQKIEFLRPLDSYPGALGQILINLLQNAILHAFAGRTHGTIRITARPISEDRVRIEFSDDGIGLSSEVRANIFVPFFSTRSEHGGSGVGLSYSKRLLETTLGGSIAVSSTPQAGTSFVMDIPVDAPQGV